MAIYRIEIPYKFPSFNEYVNECRKNKYAGGSMKKKIQKDISLFINRLPKYDKPIKIHFHWIEGNKRRDLDNVAYAKKFILDTLVACGKLENDNRNYVYAFTDSFEYGKETKVILEIEEKDGSFNNI
jgi:Holliday junction resolvase RusA-like endonuclease